MSEAEDTPTHRMHQSQMSIARLRNWIELIRANRAQVIEKAARVKKATENDSSKQLRAMLKKIERLLESASEDIEAAEELMRDKRMLIFEASGQVFDNVELQKHGTEQDASPERTGGDESEDGEDADEASS